MRPAELLSGLGLSGLLTLVFVAGFVWLWVGLLVAQRAAVLLILVQARASLRCARGQRVLSAVWVSAVGAMPVILLVLRVGREVARERAMRIHRRHPVLATQPVLLP